jgi:predicted DNA-binding transcriptional regulator AlpA
MHPVQPVHEPGDDAAGTAIIFLFHGGDPGIKKLRWKLGERAVSVFCHFYLTLFLYRTHQPPAFGKETKSMKTETISVIRSILTADETLPKEEIDDILLSVRQTTKHRHLINAREAMSILRVSRPTLRSYVKQGLVEQIAFSPRRVRFDEDGIRRFAERGITSSSGSSRIAPGLIAH